ncbi:MAG: PPOX class probable F420-dependent enzyme [Candidatus Binatia bacterium]|jgi:PPOX class probable F420-dependent enzyme
MALSDLPFQKMGEQPAFDPAGLEEFVAAPRIAILAYARRDGTPVQVPIWYAYEDGDFRMLTGRTSVKAKALARNPRASLTIQDETPPYRAVIMDGDVAISEVPLETDLNPYLARRYFGKFGGREYEKMSADEYAKTGLCELRFQPTRVRGFDNHKLLGFALRAYMRVRAALPIPTDWL